MSRLLLTGVLFLTLSFSAMAQEETSIKVIGYPPDNGSKLPFYLALEAGIFKKNGLAVSFKDPGSNESLLKSMRNGEADVYVASVPHIVRNKADGGGDLVITANTGYNYFKFMAHPSIRAPGDLKGKKVGTGRPGSGRHLITRIILTKLGLDPDRDVTLVPYGGETLSRVVALASGEVAAASVTSEGLFMLEKSGDGKKLRVLADYKSLGLYAGGGADYAFSPTFLRRSRGKAKQFLRSISEAIALARKEKPLAVEVMGKTMQIIDPALLDFVYRVYVGEVIPAIPHPRIESIELALEMAGAGAQEKQIKAQDLIDPTLVRELEKEGLFERLYR
jgi:ABC-type nitrate/sulfonate/bicarbonate transport system substrate-binding protein